MKFLFENFKKIYLFFSTLWLNLWFSNFSEFSGPFPLFRDFETLVALCLEHYSKIQVKINKKGDYFETVSDFLFLSSKIVKAKKRLLQKSPSSYLRTPGLNHFLEFNTQTIYSNSNCRNKKYLLQEKEQHLSQSA